MEFIIDVLIIIGCYGLSYWVVHNNSNLSKLLIPIPVKDKYSLGNRVVFRFIPLAKSKADVPYNILIVLLFLIMALIIKSLFHNTEGWESFWFGYILVFLVLVSVTYNAIVLLIIAGLYLIPLALAYAAGLEPQWMGVLVGIIPGAYGGVYIGVHYWLTRARIENEIFHKKDLEGNDLGRFNLTFLKVKDVWLRWSVLLTVMAIISFWMNWNSAVGYNLSGSSSIYQYGGVFLWTIISLNVFLFSVPLLIEMVQQASWTSAGLFSDKVKNKDEDELLVHVCKYGRYNGFSIVTGFILGAMCLTISAIVAGNIIEKLLLGNILLPSQNQYLMLVSLFLSGFIFSIHIGFLMVYMAFMLIPARFLEKEILDQKLIADKLLNSNEPVFSQLRRLLPDETLRNLAFYMSNAEALKTEVCYALNQLSYVGDLHTKINLDYLNLGEESAMLISKAKYGQVKKRINKHLLADLFPLAIDRVERYLHNALIFREYIQLRKMGLSNPDLRFFVETKNLFYPCVKVKP